MSLLVYVAVFLVTSSVLLQCVNNAIPTPYIDEAFHIPQTQKYCNGSFFEWNDKITTLPGLYIFSLMLQLPLMLTFSDAYCSIFSLRSVNVLVNVANFLLIYFIMRTIHFDGKTKKEKPAVMKEEEDTAIKLQSFSLATFPLLYFFTFLYYTDPSATMFVLAAYLANCMSKHKVSALLGLISVIFRQTNIVWVLFMAGSTVAKELMKVSHIREIETSPDIKDKLARFLTDIIAAVSRYLLVVDNLLRMLYLVLPYICVVLCFGVFVLINGGVVVGDKSNHIATFHGPQLLYFLGFTLFFSSPILVSKSQILRFGQSLQKRPPKYVTFAAIFFFLILNYTQVHPYLLADNRHYPFHLWRLVLKYRFVQFALIPIYIYSGWSIHHALNGPTCSGIWKLVFVTCISAVTMPQKLIELRYFIIPYILFRVNVLVRNKFILIMELLLYTSVNAFTFFIFFNKTFTWPDIAEPQRIIW